ncbi:amidohydrolase family protein [Pseudomonas fluorescens]|uniref:amidohydrolase family protein n=1 Tax=Pseudomonas fluorescens TaxID=294 RepID=UPI003F961BE6
MCKMCESNSNNQGENHIHKLSSEGQAWISKLTVGVTSQTSSKAEKPRFAGHPGKKVVIRGGNILTMDDSLGDFEGGDLLIEGNKIVAIGYNLDIQDAEVIDAKGKIVMPGFIDTHHHQFETALRSSLVNGMLVDDGTEQGKINYLSHILGKLAPVYLPEDVYTSELFGSLSQLDAGVTTVLDVSQIHHSPEHTDAAIEALRDSGRRSVLGYFEGSGEGYKYPEDAYRVRQRYFSSDDQLVTMAMGGEVYLPNWERAWQIAKELDLNVALHVVGSMGMAEHMEKIATSGMLTDRHLLIHMTGMSDLTWTAARDAGAKVSLAVPIEMTMRHGTPPIQKTLEMGMLPSFSSDVECTLTADFFTQMRSALTLQRGQIHERALAGEQGLPPLLTARDVIRFATVGGAEALGMSHRVGSLSVGKSADVLLLDAEALNVAPLNNVPGAVVSLMERNNVDTVIVDGQIKKWKGILVGIDVPKLTAAITESRNNIFSRAGIQPSLFD